MKRDFFAANQKWFYDLAYHAQFESIQKRLVGVMGDEWGWGYDTEKALDGVNPECRK